MAKVLMIRKVEVTTTEYEIFSVDPNDVENSIIGNAPLTVLSATENTITVVEEFRELTATEILMHNTLLGTSGAVP